MPAAGKPDWQGVFLQMVEDSLRHSIILVQANVNTPQAFRPHMDSLTSQIRWGARFAPELAARLTVAAYPWPARWGQTDSWRQHLEQVRHGVAPSHPLHRQALACLADIFQLSGQPEKVVEIAGTLFDDPTVPLEELEWLVARGGGAWLSALTSQGKTVEAEQAAMSLWGRLESAPLQTHLAAQAEARAVVLLHRSIAARRKGDLALALDLISQAIVGMERQRDADRSSMSEIIQSRAIYHWVGADYPSALADLDYAQRVSTSAADMIGLCSIHGNRGLVYWSMSAFDLAERELLAGIHLAEKNKWTYLLMKQVGNLGMVYLNLGDLQNALGYIEREQELARIAGDEYEKALAEGNRAAVQIYTDHPEQALPGLFSTLQEYANTERHETLVGTLVDLSICHYRIGNPQASAQFAQQAYDLARTGDIPVLLLIASRALALCAPPSEAVSILQQALQLAERLDRKLDMAGCKLSLAHLATKRETRLRAWEQAVDILNQIGATKWVENQPVGALILLPMTV